MLEQQRSKFKEQQQRDHREAATRIQAEIRRFQDKQREQRKLEQEQLAAMMEDQERKLKELEQTPIEIEGADGKEKELVDAEIETTKAKRRFQAAIDALSRLDKDKIQQLKSMKAPPKAVPQVLTAILLLLDHKYSTVRKWPEIRSVSDTDRIEEGAAEKSLLALLLLIIIIIIIIKFRFFRK